MYDVTRGTSVNSTRSVVRNRHGLWRNRYRNDLIAEIATNTPEDEQLLIIVDKVEHALYLKKLLPSYPIVFSSMSNANLRRAVQRGDFGHVEGIDANGNMRDSWVGKCKREFEAGTLKRAIATSIWNTGVDFKHLAHLIRAEGLGSTIQSIQTPGRLSRTLDGKAHGHLIDFIDSFDDRLLARSKKRMKQYKDMGWTVNVIKGCTAGPHIVSPRGT
jgi:superfamily II DNA or RNA helicase